MLNITTKEEFEKILDENRDKTVALKFGAEWCGPCGTMKETIECLETDDTKNVLFVSCDVDEADEDFLDEYNVSTLPTMIFFKNGIVSETYVGLMSKEELKSKF